MNIQNERANLLQEGIFLILSQWDSLETALENRTLRDQTPAVADKIFAKVYRWFTKRRKADEPLYIDRLEKILDKGMDMLLMDFEDGGLEIDEVAYKLMDMHEDWLAGDYSYLERLRSAPPRPRPRLIQAASDDDDDDDDDSSGLSDDEDGDDVMISEGAVSDMVVDSPAAMATNVAAAQTGEDGWTMVRRSRRRRDRNLGV